MRKNLFVFFILFIHLNGFSQKNTSINISEDIELIQISENAYVHVSSIDMPPYGRISANGLIFTNNGEAFVFDSPWNDSLTKDLYFYLADSMKLKIKGFIPNHWHEDCMGGLRFLKSQKIESYAYQVTIDSAKSKNLPVPDHAFIDSLQLYLGDSHIFCYYLGAAHATDNIVIWIPSEQILFAGCMVKSLNSDNLGNIADGDISSYPETINRVLKKFPNAKIVVPGHGPHGGIELLNHTKNLALELL